jgi:hypothetical protein
LDFSCRFPEKLFSSITTGDFEELVNVRSTEFCDWTAGEFFSKDDVKLDDDFNFDEAFEEAIASGTTSFLFIFYLL